MWVKVRQVIRSKRTGLVVLSCMVLAAAAATAYGQGYEHGFDHGWTYGRLEHRLDMLERTYLPAAPDLGSAAENPAR